MDSKTAAPATGATTQDDSHDNNKNPIRPYAASRLAALRSSSAAF